MNITANTNITSEASERFTGLLNVQMLQEKMLKIAFPTWMQRKILGADDSTISIKERDK